MRAVAYIQHQLTDAHAEYANRFAGQPRVSVNFRLPAELVAAIDVLKDAGLGPTRTAVVQVMLDLAIDQVKHERAGLFAHGEYDQAVSDQLDQMELNLGGGDE